MTDVALNCHRCWRSLDDPYEGAPPYSSTFAAPGGTVLLLILCPPCRDRFADDGARREFLVRIARVAPPDPTTATRPGLRTLVWAIRRARVVPVSPAAPPGGRGGAGARPVRYVEIREAG